ncbi:hypothetical protein NL676_035921 [Syzygium grande]|nr:hypothetical protein NL676_035921 [Syzygium grande]
MGGHHHHHPHGSDDGDGVVSQRVNSPRFSGPMTRRGHSFKRASSTAAAAAQAKDTTGAGSGSGTAALHEVIDLQINSPRSENGNVHGAAAYDLAVDWKQTHHRYNLRERSGPVEEAGGICANGWFGSAIERAESNGGLYDQSAALQILINQRTYPDYDR